MNKLFDKIVNSLKNYSLSRVRFILFVLQIMIAMLIGVLLGQLLDSESLVIFGAIVIFFVLDFLLKKKVVDKVIEIHCNEK